MHCAIEDKSQFGIFNSQMSQLSAFEVGLRDFINITFLDKNRTFNLVCERLDTK